MNYYNQILSKINGIILKNYILFKEKNVDWNTIYQKHYYNIHNSIDEKNFVENINNMLLDLKDPHVTFKNITTKLKYTIPFEVKFVEDKLVVVTDGYKIPKNAVILKVDNMDISNLIASYPDEFPFSAVKIQILEKIYSNLNKITNYQYTWNQKNYSIQLPNNLINYDLIKALPIQKKKLLNNNINIKELSKKIGYIKITCFTNKISEILQNWISKLEKGKNLIIDLRNSCGGNVDETIKSVSLFLEQDVDLGEKVYKKDGKEVKEKILAEAPIKSVCLKKIVVLVNSYTISSSEFIFLRAISENNNTKVIGEITSGIVHGAKRFFIDNKYLLTLTTSKYYDKG